MRHEASTTVDRGRYEDAVTPWEEESWRTAAFGWVEDELAARGLRVDGTWQVRVRPWSVLVRIPVAGGGPVWFKANPPASAFEGPLTAALARLVPRHVLRPLAVDAERGWSLLPDGGALFRDVLARDEAGPGAWEDLLRQYASMQVALVPHARDLELLGVPGARTTALPALFDTLLAENTALSPEQRARLGALRPRLVGWCEDLASLGIPDTLDHADLHDGQLFHPGPGRFTFFDWGDAAVSHPFCSLLIPAQWAAERHGPAILPRLRDAYLEPWTGHGRTAAELRSAVGPAWRLGALGRARAWGRLFPTATDAGAVAGHAAESLMQLFTEPAL